MIDCLLFLGKNVDYLENGNGKIIYFFFVLLNKLLNI
jgi:hypothetical protein